MKVASIAKGFHRLWKRNLDTKSFRKSNATVCMLLRKKTDITF